MENIKKYERKHKIRTIAVTYNIRNQSLCTGNCIVLRMNEYISQYMYVKNIPQTTKLMCTDSTISLWN